MPVPEPWGGNETAAGKKRDENAPAQAGRPRSSGNGHRLLVTGPVEVATQAGEFTEIKVVLPRVAALLPERS